VRGEGAASSGWWASVPASRRGVDFPERLRPSMVDQALREFERIAAGRPGVEAGGGAGRPRRRHAGAGGLDDDAARTALPYAKQDAFT
ncbi:MAG: hypothetical protein IPL76_03230, partial [Gemmatimonadetes bacterium]|nr:hypothetical protein [Gemmatimonadota bacterium]